MDHEVTIQMDFLLSFFERLYYVRNKKLPEISLLIKENQQKHTCQWNTKASLQERQI